MQIPKILQTISQVLSRQHARVIVVGGAVRDSILGREIKDYDIEVYGLSHLEKLEEILREYGSVNLVGKSFGILKFHHQGAVYDFSFPRQEKKSGRGHRGFEVKVDSCLNFEEAAKRRDFTINALGYDIETGEIIDPFGGREDIEKRVLRHIDAQTFVEDPLRVYRAIQFAARFGFVWDAKTSMLCREMVGNGMLDELPKERVYEEWKKLLLQAPKPSVGFELMRELGILERYFPELHALIGVPQDPRWHPEGDVWIHTMMSIDAMALMLREQEAGSEDEKQKLKYLFATLCHDLGKPETTTLEADGRIRSIGHEKAGLEPTQSLMYRLIHEHDFIKTILPLVEHHLKPTQFYAQGAKAGAIRRLATKVNIKELVMVAKADYLGRTTSDAKRGRYDAGEWLLCEAARLHVSEAPIKPLILGRDLIELGFEPSPKFKKILDEIYDLQIEKGYYDKREFLKYLMKNWKR